MHADLLKIIETDFKIKEREFVISQLNSITKAHIMAQSEKNLNRTKIAILQLSKGDSSKIKDLVISAKSDFRDVIYWASTL